MERTELTAPTCWSETFGLPRIIQVAASVATFIVYLTMSDVALAQSAPSAPAASIGIASSEWERIREGRKQAKPMPDPQGAVAPKFRTPSGDLQRYDGTTGERTSLPAASDDPSVTGASASVMGRTSSLPISTEGIPLQLPQSFPEGDGHVGLANFDPQAVTPPGPLYQPYTFPWNTEFRLLMRYPVAGFADQYFLCSASAVSSFHLLSAGHCIYDHDPLQDGSGRGAGFAAEVWAWPAETDVVNPLDPDNWPDFPYGVAKMVWETTYNAWINSSDLNWDMSWITLDRRIGDHVGWMGREWGVNASALNFDGYPAEAPYVPSNNPYQYPGFDAGNVASYDCCRIALNAFTYGGHSGGGVWRYVSSTSSRYIQGVNSTSNRAGSAHANLFRAQTNTDLVNTITNDQVVRPPTDRAQLIEYVFDGTSKGLVDTSVTIGRNFRLKLNAFNAGYIDAGTTTADIYLTTNPNSTASWIYIDSVNLGSLATYSYTVQTQFVDIPGYVAPGSYYVGWALFGANMQYGTDRNYAIITNQTLTVSAAPPVLVSVASRKVHGAAGTFNLSLGSSVSNPTTEPRQGTTTIVFTFDKPLSSATANVVEGIATAGTPTVSGSSVLVPLAGVANAQYVTIALSNVTATDGGTGGSGSRRVGFLAGDVNQSRGVSLADVGLVNAQLAIPVTAANYLKDVNASGTLTLADKGITNANLTKALPAP
jgi:V8-like Glu-specific endopeptidase